MERAFEIVGQIIAGCFSAFTALIILIVIVGFVADRVMIHRFRRKYQGMYVLICSPRHGWHDFIHNNVIPVLPSNCAVEWTSRVRDAANPALAALATLRIRGEKPLLVRVGGRIRGISLHKHLLPLRATARKDTTVQRQIVDIVAAAQQGIT